MYTPHTPLSEAAVAILTGVRDGKAVVAGEDTDAALRELVRCGALWWLTAAEVGDEDLEGWHVTTRGWDLILGLAQPPIDIGSLLDQARREPATTARRLISAATNRLRTRKG